MRDGGEDGEEDAVCGGAVPAHRKAPSGRTSGTASRNEVSLADVRECNRCGDGIGVVPRRKSRVSNVGRWQARHPLTREADMEQSYSDVYVHGLQRALDESRQVNATIVKQRDAAVKAMTQAQAALMWIRDTAPAAITQICGVPEAIESLRSALLTPTK